MNTPSPSEIKAIRQELGLSVAGLADALGYSGQDRLIRALEVGERGGEPFTMTGPATAALHYLRGIVRVLRLYHDWGGGPEAMRELRALLPEELR